MLSGSSEPTIGDGIVSLEYAHLEGARQLTLDGVHHSINAPEDYWYGGETVVDLWLPVVRALVKKSCVGAVSRKLHEQMK